MECICAIAVIGNISTPNTRYRSYGKAVAVWIDVIAEKVVSRQHEIGAGFGGEEVVIRPWRLVDQSGADVNVDPTPGFVGAVRNHVLKRRQAASGGRAESISAVGIGCNAAAPNIRHRSDGKGVAIGIPIVAEKIIGAQHEIGAGGGGEEIVLRPRRLIEVTADINVNPTPGFVRAVGYNVFKRCISGISDIRREGVSAVAVIGNRTAPVSTYGIYAKGIILWIPVVAEKLVRSDYKFGAGSGGEEVVTGKRSLVEVAADINVDPAP